MSPPVNEQLAEGQECLSRRTPEEIDRQAYTEAVNYCDRHYSLAQMQDLFDHLKQSPKSSEAIAEFQAQNLAFVKSYLRQKEGLPPESDKGYMSPPPYFRSTLPQIEWSGEQTPAYSIQSPEHHEAPTTSPLDIHEYCETKVVNGKNTVVLDHATVEALTSYENHPDRLVTVVAQKEIQALHAERDTERRALEEQKRTIILSGNYPQGWDGIVIASDEKYKARETEILIANTPKAQALVQALRSDQWQTIVRDTVLFVQETETKNSIRRWLGFLDDASWEKGIKGTLQTLRRHEPWSTDAPPDKDTSPDRKEEITATVYAKTQAMLAKMQEVWPKIHRDIEAAKVQHPTMLRAGGSEAVYENTLADIPKRYAEEIQGELKAYAKDIGEYLVGLDPLPAVVSQGERFILPVGGEKIVLDFSQMGNIQNTNDPDARKKLLDTNFDGVYRYGLGEEKIKDALKTVIASVQEHPGETAIDVIGMVAGAIVTILVTTGTDGAAVPVAMTFLKTGEKLLKAGTIFTATDNTVRAVGYGALGTYQGHPTGESALAGLGIKPTDSAADIIREKSLELASNTVLFGTFHIAGVTERLAKSGITKLIDPTITTVEREAFAKTALGKGIDRIATPTIKTGAEALFFTYFVAFITGVDNAIKQQMDAGITMDEATKIVQAEIAKIHDFDTFMQSYIYNLGFVGAVKSGIAIGRKGVDMVVPPPPLQPQIAPGEKNEPNSGNAGKTVSTSTMAERKVEALRVNAGQAQAQGIGYALSDSTVFDAVQNTWLAPGSTGVQEGLMKKSGFEDFEVDSYREGKLRGKTDAEKGAFEAMERAKEVIVKQYQSIDILLDDATNWKMSQESVWKELTQKYHISHDHISKLLLLSSRPAIRGK